MEQIEIDKTFEYYEKRYNLTKMASDCGIPAKTFNSLDSKEKFLTLSFKLKESNKINLASFFFGKLFEVSTDTTALLNKIECLIRLNEFEEAIKFNNIGWELFLEDPEIDSHETEKQLSYQKALINFFIEKYSDCETICEESIIKFKTHEFYYLLCADFIAMDNVKSAKKLFDKYAVKLGDSTQFLLEVFIHLLDINQLDRAISFANSIINMSDKQKKDIINNINKYYSYNKNKTVLKKYFENELNFSSNIKR